MKKTLKELLSKNVGRKQPVVFAFGRLNPPTQGHQKLNGELRLEIVKLNEEKEKLLKDQDIKNDQHTIELLQKDNEIGRLMKKLQDKR